MSPRARLGLAAGNAAALLVALVCNGLANALPLNGRTTGALSDRYPNLFTPAGWTFSIWGPLYLALLASVIAGLVVARQPRTPHPVAQLGPWLMVNLLANAAWIVAWHWTRVGLSVVLMGVILGSLVAMVRRLGAGLPGAPPLDRWLFHAPVQLYLGWISVATVANVTTLAVDLGAPSFGAVPAALTVGVLVVTTGLALGALWRRQDVLYAGVIAWALLGITARRWGAPEVGSEPVAWAAAVGLAVVLGAIGWTRLRPLRA